MGRLPVSDPAATWLQLAAVLSVDDLVAAGDYLVHEPPVAKREPQHHPRPLTSIEELRRRVCGFHGRGATKAVAALPLLRTGAESRRESLLRLLLAQHGFPEPDVNDTLFDEFGDKIGRFDLVYWPWKVTVEYDGDQHRTDTRQYEKDQRRLESAVHAGWIVIKVRMAGLGRERAATVSRVEHALRKRGWQPEGSDRTGRGVRHRR